MNWYARAKNSNRSRLASAETILSLAISFGAMALVFTAYASLNWTWLLVLGIGLAVLVMGIFFRALWRDLGGQGEPSLFAAARNDARITGPPSRVFLSIAALALVAVYGAYALVMRRAYAIVPDGIALLEGLECGLYGLGCLLISLAGIVRFHTSWRRAHAAFSILCVLALVLLIAAMLLFEEG